MKRIVDLATTEHPFSLELYAQMSGCGWFRMLKHPFVGCTNTSGAGGVSRPGTGKWHVARNYKLEECKIPENVRSRSCSICAAVLQDPLSTTTIPHNGVCTHTFALSSHRVDLI